MPCFKRSLADGKFPLPGRWCTYMRVGETHARYDMVHIHAFDVCVSRGFTPRVGGPSQPTSARCFQGCSVRTGICQQQTDNGKIAGKGFILGMQNTSGGLGLFRGQWGVCREHSCGAPMAEHSRNKMTHWTLGALFFRLHP